MASGVVVYYGFAGADPLNRNQTAPGKATLVFSHSGGSQQQKPKAEATTVGGDGGTQLVLSKFT